MQKDKLTKERIEKKKRKKRGKWKKDWEKNPNIENSIPDYENSSARTRPPPTLNGRRLEWVELAPSLSEGVPCTLWGLYCWPCPLKRPQYSIEHTACISFHFLRHNSLNCLFSACFLIELLREMDYTWNFNKHALSFLRLCVFILCFDS